MRYNFTKETETAKLPTRHTQVSAGVDFYSDETVAIPANGRAVISTGISWNPSFNSKESFSFPFSCFVSLIIQSRSGLAFKENIECSNAGVIDQDYVSTAENKAVINVMMHNHNSEPRHIYKGMKIAQGVPNLIPYFEDVENLDVTRDGLGFGSSDEKENK